jgi:predicted nuclease of predicted toxin-antitoxin system
VKFLVDANLPSALAQWLRESGHDATHVDDVLAAPATDAEIWSLATVEERVVITKDSDFAFRCEHDPSVRVVWVRCGNLKLSVFRAWFAAREQAALDLLVLNERLVELR